METLKKSLSRSKSNKELNFDSLNNITSNLQQPFGNKKNSNLVDSVKNNTNDKISNLSNNDIKSLANTPLNQFSKLKTATSNLGNKTK